VLIVTNQTETRPSAGAAPTFGWSAFGLLGKCGRNTHEAPWEAVHPKVENFSAAQPTCAFGAAGRGEDGLRDDVPLPARLPRPRAVAVRPEQLEGGELALRVEVERPREPFPVERPGNLLEQHAEAGHELAVRPARSEPLAGLDQRGVLVD